MNHRNSVLHSGLVALLGILVGMVSPALSQVTAGGIRGVVSDPTGAVIPGADITAMNTATGQAASASDHRGRRFRTRQHTCRRL